MRIVLTRLDRVGDLVLSTPAIRSVRRSWPDAHITLACSAYNAVAVERNPDVDAVVTVPAQMRPEIVGARFRGRCDLALALAPCTPDWRFVRATNARRRIGYTYARRYLARLTARRFLTDLCISDADPARSQRDPERPVRHEVDQVLELVRRAGGRSISDELVLSVDDAARTAVADVPAGGIAIQLAPRWFSSGSSYPSFVALLGELRDLGVPLVVTHGADVRDQAHRLAAERLADRIVGDLPFAQWAAVFEKSRIVITVDTGATHVASAVRRPVVVLFEDRYYDLASREWAPYHVPAVCLRKPPDITPASLARSRTAIVSAARELLNHA
ncbi:MAG: glycosyltransferase family 9 protein [Vulcanimicrobiaceae bacterium]